MKAARRRVLAAAAAAAAAVVAATGAALLIAAGTDSSPAGATAAGSRAVEVGPGSAMRAVELPGAPAAAASAAGSIWLADPDDQLVLRIDPSRGQVVDRIPVAGQPGALAAAGGAVWVTSTLGRAAARIDPATGRVTQTIRLPGANPAAIAYRRGEVWVADPTSRALIVIDARTGAVKATHRVELRPTAIVAIRDAVWIAGHDDGVVAQIDPQSGRSLQTVRVGNGPAALAVAGGALWVANSLDSTVSRVDPASGSVVATIAVPSGPVALAAAGPAVWVASQYAGRVTRIDAATSRAARPVEVGGQPETVAAADGRVWVGTGASAASHRGGTLRLYMRGAPPSVDPTLQYTISALQYGRLAYDGLVSLQVAPGPAGLHLVPDLAVALPGPARGGTEYAFKLRRGIRYSDGRPVRAADFRRGIERLYRVGSFGTGYFDGVVGTEACGRAACDLARGIVTDERTGSVTFHLRAPDPDFLYKLTVFSYAVPIPPGVPNADARVPGTGPYRVVASSGDGMRLERNPYFREWSHAAQPAGNPDAITWRFVNSFETEARAVEEGRGDWVLGLLPPDRLAAIRVAHAAQVHTNPSLVFEFLPLNTHAAPFDDVRVRRALNYAVDRVKIARMYGPGAAAPLCQALLPGMPGYVPRCPYRHSLPRARALVAASGTRGQRVDLWGMTDQLGIPRALPRYMASVLRSLGYRVRLHLAPGARITPALRRRIQLSADGDWLADYPAPSAYLPQFFGCAGGLSNGYVCDRRLERLMARATRLQLSDPGRADAAWARVDRRITDQALWVPTATVSPPELVSRRLRNYQFHPVWGFIADQAWLR